MNLHKHYAIFFLLILTASLSAQRMIRTDHFDIYYQSGTENTARRVAEVAEEVYNPLAAAFDAFDALSRIFIFVYDDRDYSNGYASYGQNKIVIWASDLEFELRGSTNWIKNVLTHELTHIISLNVAKKNFFSFSTVRFGQYNVNPDYFFEIPLYHLNVPSWYTEGIAQLGAQSQGHDSWDTHRDMLLRMAVLENDLLTYDEMGVFVKDGLHSEMVYNQGFALVNYINKVFGEGKAEDLTHHTGLITFDTAIQRVLKKSPYDLYDEWTQSLKSGYEKQVREQLGPVDNYATGAGSRSWPSYEENPATLPVSQLTRNSVEGRMIIDGGFLDYFPAISPNGKYVAYLSNEGQDFAITDVKVYNVQTGEVKTIKKRVRSRIAWTPDSKQLIYVRPKSRFNDLFVYDLDTKKEKRISNHLRAKDPNVSPDGQWIACVRNEDGSTNLARVSIDGAHVEYLTNFNDGTQIYSPVWSPDGEKIAFSLLRENDRDIALVSASTKSFSAKSEQPDSTAMLAEDDFQILIHSVADERDPCWLPDGSGLLFSSDKNGIFNLYEYSFENHNIVKRSEVIGGAFAPSLTSNGNTIIYAGYHAANYNIYKLDRTAYEVPTVFTPVDREYLKIYTGKSIKDLYKTGSPTYALNLLGFSPIITFSPNFIGNKFTINTVNVGGEVAIGDISGRHYFYGAGIVGRSIKNADKIGLNYTVNGYYERRLPAILTQDRLLAPKGYLFGTRRVIHDYNDLSQEVTEQGLFNLIQLNQDGTADTVEVVGLLTQNWYGGQKEQYQFDYYGGGIRLPITNRQQMNLSLMERHYHWHINEAMTLNEDIRFFENGQEINLGDFSYTDSYDVDLVDAKFFKSRDVGISYQYFKGKPTADAIINPTNVRLIHLGFSRHYTTVTDSLISPADPAVYQEPVYTPVYQKYTPNRYVFNWIELVNVYRRHTLGLETMGVFLDKRIPAYEELVNIDSYFPMRVYLGGFYTLRGYPYFTLDGSQMLFGRLKYTFPIFPNIARQVFHMYLDRLYGSVFVETGATFNESSLNPDKIINGNWLRDFGFELRLSMMHFYRVPATAYFTMAFPYDETRYQNDVIKQGHYRLYFGLRVGGSY